MRHKGKTAATNQQQLVFGYAVFHIFFCVASQFIENWNFKRNRKNKLKPGKFYRMLSRTALRIASRGFVIAPIQV